MCPAGVVERRRDIFWTAEGKQCQRQGHVVKEKKPAPTSPTQTKQQELQTKQQELYPSRLPSHRELSPKRQRDDVTHGGLSTWPNPSHVGHFKQSQRLEPRVVVAAV